MRWMLLIIFVCLVLIGASLGARGQHHPPQDTELHHKFYATWLRSDIREAGQRVHSCCSQQDCYPTQFKMIGGRWHALHRETGRWIIVLDSQFEHNAPDPRESPDGRSHLCASPLGNTFCAVLGGNT